MSRPNETEQELRRAAEAGEVLDLSRRGNNELRAEAIRDLLLAEDIDPRGILVVGARITGYLNLDFVSASTPLQLDRCVFEEGCSLHDTQLPGLSLDGSTLPALHAKYLRTRHLTMVNADCAWTVDLEGATIDGPLLLNRSSVGAIVARGLSVRRGVQAANLHAGEARLDGCKVGGDLFLYGAVIVNNSGTALALNNAEISGDVILNKSFVKAGGEGSGVMMIDATARSLHMGGAVVRTATLCGVVLDGSHFKANVRLDGGFDARSKQANHGTIRIISARIDASMVIQGVVRNDDGQALIVQKAVISSSMSIADTEIRANTRQPAVEIDDSLVGGSLIFRAEKLVNRGRGYALSLSSTKVGDLLKLDLPTLLKCTVTVNGLTYPEPPDDTGAWLTLLRERNFRYEAQPYQQLAAVHRAAGHEHTARKVLIAQQRDLRHRGDPGNKLWHRILGLTLAYGYKPSRALAGLLITFLLALCLVWTAGAHDGLTPAKDRPADACSPVNRISLAADLAIPLVKLGGTPRCELANGPAGQWATGAGWVIQILGWSFATLSVAGFTGLVRKS